MCHYLKCMPTIRTPLNLSAMIIIDLLYAQVLSTAVPIL